uniref:Uncharacterized protein n=1 Tax=Candidatus Kentrum sp. LFY TaxID=2126342 RepID=A0A450WS40_9GAMM|nr:MAG: hypothetical protein BECKLFY1418C_GA0070996_106410 [Candidatus Kentron sp. LFY]
MPLALLLWVALPIVIFWAPLGERILTWNYSILLIVVLAVVLVVVPVAEAVGVAAVETEVREPLKKLSLAFFLIWKSKSVMSDFLTFLVGGKPAENMAVYLCTGKRCFSALP